MHQVDGRRLACESKVGEAKRVKHSRLLILSVALLAALAASSASANPGWLTDYKKAQEEAKASKKLVLIEFHRLRLVWLVHQAQSGGLHET